MIFGFSFKQKMKIASFLFFIMCSTMLIRMFEDKSIKNMSNAFVSMYHDRLIPATDLFFLAENVYAKRYLLEEALNPDRTVEVSFSGLREKLRVHNKNIDSLVRKYEGTFLIKKEKSHLADLKTKLSDGIKMEDNIITMAEKHTLTEGRHLFESLGKAAFNNISEKLSELSRIQTDAGEELIRESESIVSGSKMYSTAQVVLAIFIGMMIVNLVLTSKVANIHNDKFKLN